MLSIMESSRCAASSARAITISAGVSVAFSEPAARLTPPWPLIFRAVAGELAGFSGHARGVPFVVAGLF